MVISGAAAAAQIMEMPRGARKRCAFVLSTWSRWDLICLDGFDTAMIFGI